MIKRTPQEIADFFGCYVAMIADDHWHAFKSKPEISETGYWGYGYQSGSLYIKPEFINPPASHDWHTLYEPALPEKKKKLVPYDLSKKEDRDALRGKWVVDSDGVEYLINAFYPTREVCNGIYLTMRTNCGDGITLFDIFTFLDGSPVGKEVEE